MNERYPYGADTLIIPFTFVREPRGQPRLTPV